MSAARRRRPRRARAARPRAQDSAARRLIEEPSHTLLDLVDNILNKGLMVTGDVVLGLADVDLVYLRLSALLCAADKVLPGMRGGGAFPRPRRKR